MEAEFEGSWGRFGDLLLFDTPSILINDRQPFRFFDIRCRMLRRFRFLTLAGPALGLFVYLSDSLLYARQAEEVVIKAVQVEGKQLSIPPSGVLNLGTSPGAVSFSFGPGTNHLKLPLRLRCQLEGFEDGWHAGLGYMCLSIRFFNNSGDQVEQEDFPVSNDSVGWTGLIKSSSLVHRRETLIVPPNAARAWIVISSAGPPATVGIYVVANLVVSEISKNSLPSILVQNPLDVQSNRDSDKILGWTRDGTHSSMAKIIQIGEKPAIRAFAIEDDDPGAHAEWRTVKESGSFVTAGESLVVEWNEMFSIGVGDLRSLRYESLPPGHYRFRVVGLDLMGEPSGAEAAIEVIVPQPFWKRPWFWGMLLGLTAVILAAIGRYLIWQRAQREVAFFKNQQAMELERLRIARDIHDDLGTRVTQISIMSAKSLHDLKVPEKTRTELGQIKQMSRDLITALYETAWAVNPEYDNLDALENYLCQMITQLCSGPLFHCRFHSAGLPRDIQVSSQIRHNIIMAVKEAIHNAMKHSNGSELIMRMAFQDNLLTIEIQDNGSGFQVGGTKSSGNGLKNMERRMNDVGGTCSIKSDPGNGAIVQLQLPIKRDTENGAHGISDGGPEGNGHRGWWRAAADFLSRKRR